MAHPQIAVFARLAKDNATPTRLLYGQKTRLSRTMHDIRYDAVHDELLTTNPFAAAVLVYRGGANGEEAPIRIIQGPHTQMDGPARVEVDPVHNEIIVPNSSSILVFPRDANGDVAPIRVLRGPETQLRRADSVAVDAVHDVMVAAITKPQNLRGMGSGASQGWSATWTETGGGTEGGLLIFNRTDNGNVKPRAIIQGPQTGLLIPEQLQMYPPREWIVAAQSSDTRTPEPENTFVGVWSTHDSGDVPPRWRIGGPNSTIKKPRGVALNPKNKELIVADMRRNAVLTFYFPEIF